MVPCVPSSTRGIIDTEYVLFEPLPKTWHIHKLYIIAPVRSRANSGHMVSLPRRGAIGPFLKMPIYWHFCQLVGCRVTIRRKRPRASKSRTRRKFNGRLIVFAPPRYQKNIKLFFPARKKCLFRSSVTCIVVRMPNGYVCACRWNTPLVF